MAGSICEVENREVGRDGHNSFCLLFCVIILSWGKLERERMFVLGYDRLGLVRHWTDQWRGELDGVSTLTGRAPALYQQFTQFTQFDLFKFPGSDG